MNTHGDFEEFLRLLRDESVDFVIVGGYAVAFHGYVRATQDMDLFFRNNEDNIRAILRALTRFGIAVDETRIPDFADPGTVIRMGEPPARIEMISAISGACFEEVWEHRVEGKYGDVPVNYISLADLIRNKTAAGRPKDTADVDELGGGGGE